MTQTPGDHTLDESAALAVAACLFQGFSDPSRLAILRHLTLGEHRVVDLTGHLGLAQSTVSQHLACLRDCGLVSSRAHGRASLFSLTQPEATLDLLAAAERLLGLTGDAVALCPVYGVDAGRAADPGRAADAGPPARSGRDRDAGGPGDARRPGEAGR